MFGRKYKKQAEENQLVLEYERTTFLMANKNCKAYQEAILFARINDIITDEQYIAILKKYYDVLFSKED